MNTEPTSDLDADRFRLLSTGQAARILFGTERSRRRVIHLIESGQLGAIRTSETGDRRIPLAEVERMLAEVAATADARTR